MVGLYLTPPEGDVRSDLGQIASGTRTLSPVGGLDCDADGDVDLPQGLPMVCPMAYRDVDADAMTHVLVQLLEGLTYPGAVDIDVLSGAEVVREILPARFPDLNLHDEHDLDFDVVYACDRAGPGIHSVTLGATVDGEVIARTNARVTCGLLTQPDTQPPLVFVPPVPPVPPNPPQPGTGPAPAPGSAPATSQAQAQATVAQGQPAAVAQRQQQPQAAFVHAAQRIREQAGLQNAMSRLSSGRRDPISTVRGQLLGGALMLALAFSTVSISIATRLARIRNGSR